MSKQQMPFAVVDVETTGFSPHRFDRLLEIAIVRITPSGETEDEYVTLVNPLRDVGPTEIHGITATDVVEAPTFDEISGDVLARLDQAVFVAHNARFDRGFIGAELSMAGILLPEIPSLCTLALARRIFPSLPNHRLETCCEEAGLQVDRWHSALHDARATAALLTACLEAARRSGWTTLADLGCSPLTFPSGWPALPSSGRKRSRAEQGQQVADLPFLARVVASLGSVPVRSDALASYVDVLDRALEDRQVTADEADALAATARDWDISREDAVAAHHDYLESLVLAALADGKITEVERRDLEAVTRLLAIDPAILHALIERTPAPVSPIAVPTPEPGALAGKTVCFTGSLQGMRDGAPLTRELAHELAEAAGLTVKANVTKDLDLLVAADPNSQSGKGKQARKYGTRIMAEAAFWRAIGARVD